MAYSIPLTALIGIYFGGYWLFLTPAYIFVIIPIVEWTLTTLGIDELDAIIPTWAYMLISSQLENFTELVIIGDERKLFEKYFEDTVNSIDYSIYEGKSVIIKDVQIKKFRFLLITY